MDPRIALDIDSTMDLPQGGPMPLFGLGKFRSPAGREAREAVGWALEIGYRLVDTAALGRIRENADVFGFELEPPIRWRAWTRSTRTS